MSTRVSAVALMLGNVVVGIAVLAPAGMLPDLAAGLEVSIREAGLLIAYGAVILCFGSPLMAWATTRVDRRTLMAATLVLLAIGQSGLSIRAQLPRGARAALADAGGRRDLHTAGRQYDRNDRLGRERASAISFVFLGWSLSVAVALPVVTFLGALWLARHLWVLGATAAAAFALNLVGLPSGLRGAPLSLASWTAIARSRAIILLLTVTLCWTAAMLSFFRTWCRCLRGLPAPGWDRGRVLCAVRRDGLPGAT